MKAFMLYWPTLNSPPPCWGSRRGDERQQPRQIPPVPPSQRGGRAAGRPSPMATIQPLSLPLHRGRLGGSWGVPRNSRINLRNGESVLRGGLRVRKVFALLTSWKNVIIFSATSLCPPGSGVNDRGAREKSSPDRPKTAGLLRFFMCDNRKLCYNHSVFINLATPLRGCI